MDILVYGIIGIIILGIIYLVYFIVSQNIEKDAKAMQSIKETLETYGKLDDSGQNMFLRYIYKDEKYTLLIMKLSDTYKFQFNSKTIWEKKKGRQVMYLDQSVFANMPGKKIVITYPHTGPFMYHYDENEIRFTKPKEKIWDMHIIPVNQLEEVLKEGL